MSYTHRMFSAVVVTLLVVAAFSASPAAFTANAHEGGDALGGDFGRRFLRRAAQDLIPVVLEGEVPIPPPPVSSDPNSKNKAVDEIRASEHEQKQPAADKKKLRCGLESVHINATVPSIRSPFVAVDFIHTFKYNIEAPPPSSSSSSSAPPLQQSFFIFPIMPGTAITSLVAHTPRGVIRGQVKEKAAARAEYDAAVARGDGAFLSEYAEGRQDVVRLQVGNLLPGETVKVVTSVAWKMRSTTISPPDLPPAGSSSSTSKALAHLSWMFDLPLVYVVPYPNAGANMESLATPDAQKPTDRLAPAPGDWSIEVHLLDNGIGEKLQQEEKEERTPLVRCLSFSSTYAASSRRATLTKQSTVLQPLKDATLIQFAIQVPEEVLVSMSKQPSLLLASTGCPKDEEEKDDAANCSSASSRGFSLSLPMTTVLPSTFSKQSTPQQQSPRREFIFVVDRSGSMGGESMAVARQAVAIALDTLLEESGESLLAAGTAFFNVLSFGSSFQYLYTKSRAVNAAAIADAKAAVLKFDANLGGTEIERPLRNLFEAYYSYEDKDAPDVRDVFLLTDGQVGNPHGVRDLIERHHRSQQQRKTTNRVFSFGIGSGVSSEIIVESARVGRGSYVFLPSVSAEGSFLREALQDAVERSLQNSVEIVAVRLVIPGGDGELSSSAPQLSTRSLHPVSYASDGMISILGLLQHTSTQSSKDGLNDGYSLEVTLRSLYGIDDETHGGIHRVVRVPIPFNHHQHRKDVDKMTAPFALTQLAAKEQLQELEYGVHKIMEGWWGGRDDSAELQQLKSRIVDTSVKYQILSSQTSFLAVEECKRDNALRASMWASVPHVTASRSEALPSSSMSSSVSGTGASPSITPSTGIAAPRIAAAPTSMLWSVFGTGASPLSIVALLGVLMLLLLAMV